MCFELWFEMIKKMSIWIKLMTAAECELLNRASNCTLKNIYNGKFNVMFISPPFF